MLFKHVIFTSNAVKKRGNEGRGNKKKDGERKKGGGAGQILRAGGRNRTEERLQRHNANRCADGQSMISREGN